MPRFRSVKECGKGIGVHNSRASVRAKIGVARNRSGEDVEGRTGSLMNSLMPSAIGCRSP